MPKLAKATSPNAGRVTEAIALLVKCPALTLEQVMLAVRFTAADAANRAKQAWIRRRAPLKKGVEGANLNTIDKLGHSINGLLYAEKPMTPSSFVLA